MATAKKTASSRTSDSGFGSSAASSLAAARKKRESTVPKDEPKNQKFARLANARVNKAVKAMVQVGNLSGANYLYTQAQVDTIRETLMASLAETMERFQPREKAKAPSFHIEAAEVPAKEPVAA